MIWVAITAFVVIDMAVAFVVIRHIVRSSWGALMNRFPPRPPADDAVGRRFQSFSLGLLNLGGCVHVLADETALHLRPARFIRWFGADDVSVPWEALEFVRRRRRTVTVRVAGQTLTGPVWCLELVEPTGENPDIANG